MSLSMIEELKRILPPEQVLLEEPMSKHTTFRVGGPAEMFVMPQATQIANVIQLAKRYNIPVTIVGNGSNLLVGDKGIRGLVISIGKAAEGIQIDGNTMTIGAGTLLSKAAAKAADAGLSGMEFAAGIPGSLGGAIVMNAGAYGGEMKDIVTSVSVLTLEGEVLEVKAEDMQFSYRHSLVPEKGYIVLSATIQLKQEEESKIRAYMNDLKNRRVEKQPLEYPSAGSTFKRPEGYFAGKLIEDAGLRGYMVGGAQVSEKHCGFVINKDNATAKDVLQLIHDVQDRVYEQFQVKLEPEVKMLGEF